MVPTPPTVLVTVTSGIGACETKACSARGTPVFGKPAPSQQGPGTHWSLLGAFLSWSAVTLQEKLKNRMAFSK